MYKVRYLVSGEVSKYGRPVAGSAFVNEPTMAVSKEKAACNIMPRMWKKFGTGIKLVNVRVKEVC